MKQKVTLSTLLFAILSVGALYAGYNIDRVLSGNREQCSANLLTVIGGVMQEQRARMMALIFVVASALLVVTILLMQGYIKYKSDMREVTPEIQTPEAAGQGQYGTARWLKESEYHQSFDVAKIDVNSAFIKDLIRHGYDN